MTEYSKTMNIAILGGTGALGSGLALRWARAAHKVTIGSRNAERAAESAAELSEKAGFKIAGMGNEQAAKTADLVVLTVPYANHADTLDAVAEHLHGKILVDVTVPLMPPKVRTVQLPEGGSVAKNTQAKLGENVRVVSAFQNIAAAHLSDLSHEKIDCDVFVCGNDKPARGVVINLAQDAGMKAWHAGRIDNSAVAEALTSVLIFINGTYKIDGAGIKIIGEPNL
ncbi:MAG: NADPH-dependent F420 reductase [Pacificibacter sp.]|jgi:NADPH-dependent F420 reductase